MALVQWTDDLSLGVPKIDVQHKMLFRMTNDLDAAVKAGMSREEIGATLRKLCDYAVDHFATEEKYMDMDAYEEYDKHMVEHMNCTTMALEFLEQFSEGKNVDMGEFLGFVAQWVHDHIMDVDKKFGEHLRATGRA